MTRIAFAKAHGTENDFVLLPDAAVDVDLTADVVRFLCDRRAGLGADGVIRVARAAELLGKGVLDCLPDGVEPEHWFMDYRNADGSLAEMCGNGVRVFAHWVYSRGLVDDAAFVVGTRAGAREVRVHEADSLRADVEVQMGYAEVFGVSTCRLGDMSFAGLAVDMGNPHIACVVPGLDAQGLAGLPVDADARWDEEFFPQGTNIEVLTELQDIGDGAEALDGRVHMRVHERGAGETRSCGTGTVAAARAALADRGRVDGRVEVVVPGGTVMVVTDGETSTLRGPSVIVATGAVEVDCS